MTPAQAAPTFVLENRGAVPLAGEERTYDPLRQLGYLSVHGRIVVGQNGDGDFTFAPLEQTCNLGLLAPSKAIP